MKIELVDSSEFKKDKRMYYQHLCNKYLLNKSTLKFVIYLTLWLIGGRIAIKYKVEALYVIISGFLVIFCNLGVRDKDSLSAYSIFNKGYQSLMGELNESQFGYGGQQKKEEYQQEEEDMPSDFDNLSREQMMAKITKLGNKSCFCNSGRKYKKCHYYIHQRQKQEEEELIRQESKLKKK